MLAGAETDDIYVALVADLARIALPTTIMGLTLAVVGLFIAQALGEPFPFAARSQSVSCPRRASSRSFSCSCAGWRGGRSPGRRLAAGSGARS